VLRVIEAEDNTSARERGTGVAIWPQMNIRDYPNEVIDSTVIRAANFLLISCRLLMKGKLAPARAALEIELDCFEHKRRLSGDIVRQRRTNNWRCIMPTSSR
jgi:hypothetical protein